jgi:hypothetical protein
MDGVVYTYPPIIRGIQFVVQALERAGHVVSFLKFQHDLYLFRSR